MNKERDLAVFYKVLSHPARLEILNKLFIGGACHCKDFVNDMKLAQPTVSEHLNKLRKAGLISLVTKGTCSEYRLNKNKHAEFLRLHNKFNKNKPHQFKSNSSFYQKTNYDNKK
jgi:ArsR family transcriptional regulator, arsenate/arsenite/antimonite-responsive transcriptional repressor